LEIARAWTRNIGLSATVSARALKLAGICFSGFFHHHGTSPQRMETSSLAPLAPIALRYGSRALRTPADVIAWAKRRLQARMTAIFNGK
jgi:hypothetical protein